MQRCNEPSAGQILPADYGGLPEDLYERYHFTVFSTAVRCGVGSKRPNAAANLEQSTMKGARNW